MKRTLIVFALLLLNTVILHSQSAVYPLDNPPQAYPQARTGGNYMHSFYLPPPGTSTPWWPSWSPDGQWLAFSMQGSLWKVRLGDSVAYEIAHASEYLSSPEWSPDGRYIAFTAETDSQSINLRLLDVEKGTVTDLSSGDYVNLDPAWSPDSSRLAFVSTRPGGYYNIFAMDINNGRPGQIVQLTRDNAYGQDRLYFGNYDLHIQPSWSPDGKEIMFVSNRQIPLGSGGIWRMPAAANGIDQARMIHKEETLFRTRPHWSHDGKRLVYSSHLGGQFTNLFVLPVEGGEPYKMTFGDWDRFHPRWSPDGEWIAYISNLGGLPQMRLLKTYGGLDKKVEINSLRWMRPVGRVRVQIRDTYTGELVGARIYARASDGKTYVPTDAFHRRGERQVEHFFHTDGDFVLEVPEGELLLEAMRGFEHYPTAKRVDIRAKETALVTLELEPMADLETDGWYSGSNHVHMNYGGDLHNTPENLLFMADAENLNWIGELIANKDNRILDYQFFTGKPHPASDQRFLLTFNQEYRPPFYGHVSFVNLTKHLLSPFTTGYQGTAIESLYPSNTDMFRLAKQQGAVTAYVHPYPGNGDPLEGDLGGAKGFPVDAALGTVDYLEQSYASWATYRVWHHVLNNGFRIPLVGGEDSITNLAKSRIIGQFRVYCQVGSRLSWKGWLESLVNGRSFTTNGPLLEVSVDNHGPGEEIRLSPGGGSVRVKGSLRSIVPIERVELVINGQARPLGSPQNHSDPRGAGTYFTFDREIEIRHSSWLTLQAYTSASIHPIDDTFVQATTNPVWLKVGDQPVRSESSAAYFVRWIDKLTAMAQAHPGWRSQKEKDHVFQQFQEARAVYERLRNEAQAASRP